MKSCSLGLILLCLFPAPLVCAAETLSLPVVLDYPLIRSFLIQQAYQEPGDRAIPLDQHDGCARIELWEPEVGPEGTLVKTGSRIRVKAGISALGLCLRVLKWEGYIEVLQRVWVDNKTWKVRFETIDSRFYDQNRKKISIPKPLLSLIKTYLYPYLDAVVVDLAQPRNEITEFLPLVFPKEERPRILRWIDSLRPGEAKVDEDAVRISFLMEADLPEKPREPEKPLTEEEIESLTRLWEGWDAFLVCEMESLIGQSLTKDERESMLELLLSIRSHFVQALRDRDLERDLVREQFVSAWKKLSPILRKYLVRHPSASLLNLLAFFSASDALVVLDRLGPVLPIEISRDGLLRLARLLLQEGDKLSLQYSRSPDPRLRELLGLGPPLDESGPVFDFDELDLPEDKGKEEKQSGIRLLWGFLIPLAHAEGSASSPLAELKEWIPPDQNVNAYLAKVKEILEQAAGETFLKSQLEKDYQALCRNLILATAWQESCWRQFVKAKGKIRYLISHNRTSVGLMQINERIWRGFYRVESLRWNIRYNIRAGCEILHLYLRDYALKRLQSKKGTLDRNTLVQVTYGMYNAGPDEYFEFLKRSKKNAPNRRDRLFWEKYLSSKGDQFDGLSQCLTGE